MLRKGTCIGFLEDAGCGLIYDDEVVEGSSRVVFVHFRDIEPDQGWQGLQIGERVEYVLDENLGQKFHRRFAANGNGQGNGSFVRRLEEVCTDISLPEVLQDMPAEGWHPPAQGDVLFYQCVWEHKANFSSWKINGDLVFLGCSFRQSFTLKDACVNGDVHMEGCDFSGVGGASFRGLQAKALYLDFGVHGPRDMVWLNEMHIERDVVIGGAFAGCLQVMRVQDNRVVTQTARDNEVQQRACFKHLYIGKECYKSQNINRSVLSAGLDVQGLAHGECIHIENSELNSLQCTHLSGDVLLSCVHSKVLGSVEVEGNGAQSTVESINLQNSYIEGHLNVKSITIKGELNLDDATVERVVRLHHVFFGDKGGLKMARLSANRFVMDDFSGLYGLRLRENASKWKNPRFGMLWREHQERNLQQGCDIELVQEYVLLKNLLSQEGQLKLEDEAFYNMRKLGHWYQDVGMLVFNHLFGWGVRLQNILFSSLIFVLIYTCLYTQVFAMLPIHALQLSLQSMFMAFFGEIEPKVLAGSSLSWYVLSESIIGIIFVTVFVGAYVRKLLR